MKKQTGKLIGLTALAAAASINSSANGGIKPEVIKVETTDEWLLRVAKEMTAAMPLLKTKIQTKDGAVSMPVDHLARLKQIYADAPNDHEGLKAVELYALDRKKFYNKQIRAQKRVIKNQQENGNR